MAMHEGEQYQCVNEDCGCAVEVVKGPEGAGGELNPRCCCGSEMTPI